MLSFVDFGVLFVPPGKSFYTLFETLPVMFNPSIFHCFLAGINEVLQNIRRERSISAERVPAHVPSYIAACLASLLALMSLYEP